MTDSPRSFFSLLLSAISSASNLQYLLPYFLSSTGRRAGQVVAPRVPVYLPNCFCFRTFCLQVHMYRVVSSIVIIVIIIIRFRTV